MHILRQSAEHVTATVGAKLWQNLGMANLSHLREYAALLRHQKDMHTLSRQRKRRIVVGLTVVLGLTGAGYWITPPLGVMLAGIGAMALFFTAITGGSSVPHHVMTGVEGEARALETLSGLPDDHVLFNQVYIPDPAIPNGRRELDFVVVGPDAITVVEVKNTPGLIHVDPDSKQWQVVKRAGCGSRPGWNAIDNPIMQVRAQTRALERWLLEHGVAARPQPMVCFARPDAGVVDPDRADIPVVTTTELNDQLLAQSRQTSLCENDRKRIIDLLSRTGSPGMAQAA